MKLISSNLSGVLSSKRMFNALLIYGPEETEISSVKQKVLDHLAKIYNSPPEIIHMLYSSLKDNPLLLRDELISLSFFSDNKIIIVTETGATISKELCSIIQNITNNTTIIFIAGELSKSSSIRKLFEEDKSLYAIACYKPDAFSIKKTIKTYLTQHNLTHTNDIVEAISSILPANEFIIKNELEKLALYLLPHTEVMYEDLLEVIGNNSESSMDELCFAIITNNIQKLQQCLYGLHNTDAHFMLIIRVIANFCVKVIKVKLMMKEEKPLEQAVLSLRPPVFFKQKEYVIMAAKKFSLEQMQHLLSEVLDLELQLKRGITIRPEIILYQGLISLCMHKA